MNTANKFPIHYRLALHPLSTTYCTECFKDLDFIRTILYCPTTGRKHSLGALDYIFSLPDGSVATVRASRIALSHALVSRLADVYAEYFTLKDEPMFMYSVSVKVESSLEVVLRGIGGLNRMREENHRCIRVVAEALHRAQGCSKIHENGTDFTLPGRHYSWIGTKDARPLPCPNEFFPSRPSAAQH